VGLLCYDSLATENCNADSNNDAYRLGPSSVNEIEIIEISDERPTRQVVLRESNSEITGLNIINAMTAAQT
jgi:hypothetical protein